VEQPTPELEVMTNVCSLKKSFQQKFRLRLVTDYRTECGLQELR
jgi:hypothetical protein